MLSKTPQNYEGVRNEISFYQQKPIKTDDFNENKFKSAYKKGKKIKREVAENNKLLQKKKETRGR